MHPKSRRRLIKATHILCATVCALILIVCIAKSLTPNEFASSIRARESIPDQYAEFFAFATATTEMLLASLWLLRAQQKLVSTLIITLLASFTALLISEHIKSGTVTCNCFALTTGGSDTSIYFYAARNALLAAPFAMILALTAQQRTKPCQKLAQA